jgi:hypothetical protein
MPEAQLPSRGAPIRVLRDLRSRRYLSAQWRRTWPALENSQGGLVLEANTE